MTTAVLISDNHGHRPNVPDGDILIHAGDLTMSGTRAEVASMGKWLQSLPHKHKVVIAGNHDWLFEKDKAQAISLLGLGVTYLENSGIEILGLKIWGSPVQPRFYDWAFNVNRGAAIKAYWDQIPMDTDVLITHGPPMGILDQANPARNTEHCGCDDLYNAINRVQPRIHVFGHVHGGYGKWVTERETVCYNASVVDEQYDVRNEPWQVNL